MDDAQARALAQRVETLLESLDALADPAARETATAAVQALVELYGEALGRIMRHLAGAGALLETVAGDDVVGNLLLAHGLHPLDAEARVRRELATLAARLSTHGATAELLGVEDGVVRVALRAGGNRCGSTAAALRNLIEEALVRAAPELDRIEVEAGAAPPVLLQIGVRPAAAALGGAAR